MTKEVNVSEPGSKSQGSDEEDKGRARLLLLGFVGFLLVVVSRLNTPSPAAKTPSLLTARVGFQTQIVKQGHVALDQEELQAAFDAEVAARNIRR